MEEDENPPLLSGRLRSLINEYGWNMDISGGGHGAVLVSNKVQQSNLGPLAVTRVIVELVATIYMYACLFHYHLLNWY